MQFGPFYEMMFKNRAFSVHASFLRDELVKFGQLHWENALIDGKLLRGPHAKDERRFISSVLESLRKMRVISTRYLLRVNLDESGTTILFMKK